LCSFSTVMTASFMGGQNRTPGSKKQALFPPAVGGPDFQA
jgi:hypothetical protein